MWQWLPAQKRNVIHLTITQEGLPTIKCLTEAGMIGKIGLNSAGVGVCFNAIRVAGMDGTRMPVHLGLRTALESSSATEAVAKLEEVGMASSAHMLIGDATTATGLEITSGTFAHLPVDEKGRVIHSNHLLLPHPGGVHEPLWLADSPVRVEVMEKNTAAVSDSLSFDVFSRQFEDETNYPAAICRKAEGNIDSETLFNIVMDLRNKKAVVRMGRPVKPEEIIDFGF
jgi:isopenicillin-N N-acyltransferase-like protein